MKPLPEFRLIQPQTVEVYLPYYLENDYGEAWTTYPETGEQVAVIVAAGNTASVPENSTPFATETVYTLSFPKTWEKSLSEAIIKVNGESYRVQGDPQPHPPQNTPGNYNRNVTVERAEIG